jgi:flagellar biogenesis protein FliO
MMVHFEHADGRKKSETLFLSSTLIKIICLVAAFLLLYKRIFYRRGKVDFFKKRR